MAGDETPTLRRLLRPVLGPPWRALLRGRRIVTIEWPAAISGWRARDLDPSAVLRAWPDTDPVLRPDVAVFIHFDPEGRVRPRVRRYLAALREAGLSVVFASNAERLLPDDEAALRGLCDAYLVRRNIGYDFGAMREALTHWRLPREATRSVLLVNDSVVGPFALLRPLLDRIDFATADVWGATDSPQRGWHLQSFFLAAGRAALTHPAWAAFWDDVRPAQSKEWVIGRYEIGLSQRLLASGLRGRALFPYEALLARLAEDGPASPAHSAQRMQSRRIVARGGVLNPTAHLWREVLRAGFPFIKRELLGRNPAKIRDVAEWRAEAGEGAAGDWS